MGTDERATAQARTTATLPLAAGEAAADRGRAVALDLAELLAQVARTGSGLTGAAADGTRIDTITALEQLKSAACAAQARLTGELAASQHGEQRAAGVPAQRADRGVAAQVALARAESPSQGSRLLGFATVLCQEMPCTMAALASGALNEWRATLVVRESACLSLADRIELDREVCGDLAQLSGLGNRAVANRARRVALRLDAAALVRRARRAESERTVTIRPAPDTMTYVTALLPMAQGVAVYAALRRAAEDAVASGEATSHGQVMADTLIARVTGRSATDPVPVQLGLVMTDASLFGAADGPGAEEPAQMGDVGPVPAGWARELVARALGEDGADQTGEAGVWLRRLFRRPGSGQLAGLESRSRRVPPNLKQFIRYRDVRCRTPWCDAPIRHQDHILPVVRGGPTEATNLQGLCEACNYAKQAPGWQQRAVVEETGRHAVETVTPTGRRYRGLAPPLPGSGAGTGAPPWRGPMIDTVSLSRLEVVLTDLLHRAA